METTSENNKGFINVCACEGGSGIFAFIFTLLALGFLLSIVIFG